MRLLLNRLSRISPKTTIMITLSTLYANYHRKQLKRQSVANIECRLPIMAFRRCLTTGHKTLDDISRQMEDCMTKVIVRLYTDMDNDPVVGVGTGFVVDYKADRYILTNCHVSEGATVVVAFLYETDASGDVRISPTNYHRVRVVYCEPDIDVALLKVRKGRLKRPAVTFGPTITGQHVVSFGNGGMNFNLCDGVVADGSREGSTISDDCYEYFHNLLDRECRHVYHMCPIVGGFSGGPLLDVTTGRVVAINWGAFNTSAHSFATPAHVIQNFLKRAEVYETEDMVKRYTYFGPKSLAIAVIPLEYVRTRRRTGSKREGVPNMTRFAVDIDNGLMVWAVIGTDPSSPTKEHRLMRFDIIVTVNKTTINSVNDLRNMIKNSGEEEVLDIRVMRVSNEHPIQLNVKPIHFKCPSI